MKKTVEDFYNVQWGSDQTVQDYNLFLTIFDSALQKSYQLLGNLSGKQFLEIGFGSGQQAFHFASLGAKVTAIDISRQSFNTLQKEIKNKKIRNITLKLMNAENLLFAPDTFDIIYINSVLMHVKRDTVFQQCLRVLKPQGKLIILEPLQGNPLLTLIRLFSKYRHTNPQYPRLKNVRRYGSLFNTYNHHEFYLFSWCCLPLYSLTKNKKKVLYLQKKLEKLEQGVLGLFPFLRSWCWVSVAAYTK